MPLIPLNITMLLNHSQLSKDDSSSPCTEPPSISQCLRDCHPDRPIVRGCVPAYAVQSRHNYPSQPEAGTSLPDLSTDLSTSGFSQSSLLPQPIFCLQAYFFPLIPDPTHWQPFMRLKDEENLLLWTCFSTALSGEALSLFRFWADPLSHSQLSTHFFYLWSCKFRKEIIWKSHLKRAQESAWLCPHQHEQTWHHSFQQEHIVMQTPNASENPILKLCRAQHTTRRVLFAATAVSLYPFPSFFFLSSTKQPLPARSHGILSTLPKRNKTPSHFLWHSV